jgi:hypothetical protein
MAALKGEVMTEFSTDKINLIFDRTYNGKTNFMTGQIERYGKAGKYLYELSSGMGINGTRIYGLTVLHLDGSKTEGLNSCFVCLKTAERFIKSLREE